MKAVHLYWMLLTGSIPVHPLFSQNNSPFNYDNIVPNPGFEIWDFPPVGWYYRGEHFTQVMKYWYSPTGTSPDAYGPKVIVPATWAEKGFGKTKAHSGNSFAGITTYGCSGKPHCREYVAVQLNEPLVTGQRYYVEFWVNHLPYSMRAGQIGVSFSEKKIDTKTETPLTCIPYMYAEDIILAKNLEWTKVSGYFQADNEAEYLMVGNFFPDSLTKVKPAWKDPLDFAYYYIDDITIRKEVPILPVPVKADDLTKVHPTKGKVVVLKDIYFDFDRTELMPRSYVELKKLLTLMLEYPAMQILIIGHTDSQGGLDYNQKLSGLRAQAVADYLEKNGINKTRLSAKGKGSLHPVASNDTEEGRQRNRRVEFMIISVE